MGFLLGLDIGTEGTKALVCQAGGAVLGAAEVEHDVWSPQVGWSEQDPDQWWAAACEAARAAMGRARVEPAGCRAIGLSGQMHGAVLLSGGGPGEAEVLRPAILWNDQRTANQCRAIEKAAGGRRKLIQKVGNPASTGFTAPKLLWVMQHEPEVWDQTRWVLLPKDYVRFRMTGDIATDVGDASGTLLFDVRRRRWHKTLTRDAGIDPAVLPACFESHEVAGELSRAAAEAMGLRRGVPVVAGSGNQPAGAVAAGIVRPGVVGAALGTSGVVLAHAERPMFDSRGRVHTMCHAAAGRWCVFGCMLSAGGSLQWFRNHMAKAERDRARQRGGDAYDLLIAEAEDAPPGSEGLLFMPYLTGERCPHPDPLARGGWVGLTSRHTRAMMIRAVLEGVTFGMADILQIIRRMGVEAEVVRLSGGGARSPFWRELQTDVYNLPTAATPAEHGPAYGAAILAGVGSGLWDSVEQACEALVPETDPDEPDRDLARFYRKARRAYRKLYPALRDVFPDLAELSGWV